MILQLENNPAIENLRHYPPETVENLREMLAIGAPAIPDPHRKDFYDPLNGDRVYYIHISPSGKVLFLATWPKESAGEVPLVEATSTCYR